MKKPQLDHRHAPAAHISYIVGFVLSIITTLVAYLFVVYEVFDKDMLIAAVLVLAVTQLIIQMVFFLHIGRGSRWKLMTFAFTTFFVLFLVIGTIWVMGHLNYNMMDMSAEEMHTYMEENQGL